MSVSEGLSRREALLGLGAVVAAATMPVLPSLAASAPPAAAVAEPLAKAWIVGTDDEWNYHFIRAETAEEAVRFRAEEETGESACTCAQVRLEREYAGATCEFCEAADQFEAIRVEGFDDKRGEPCNADWLREGFGTFCSRCSYETFEEGGGYAVGDEAVCADCMKLADWDVIDPERAAELRAEEAA